MALSDSMEQEDKATTISNNQQHQDAITKGKRTSASSAGSAATLSLLRPIVCSEASKRGNRHGMKT
jgi:hypothetical protein